MPEEEPTQPETPARASAARGLFRRDMERQEQLLSFAAAVLAIVLGVVLAVTYKPPAHTAHSAHAARTTSPDLLLAFSCVFGVGLWLAARHGSRVLTALVAMGLFLTAFGGTILGFPYVGLGGWLLIRNSRALREQRAAAQSQTGRSGSGRASGAGRAPRTPRETRKAKRARREAEAAEAKRIEANKRYTPPAQRRRRPGR